MNLQEKLNGEIKLAINILVTANAIGALNSTDKSWVSLIGIATDILKSTSVSLPDGSCFTISCSDDFSAILLETFLTINVVTKSVPIGEAAVFFDQLLSDKCHAFTISDIRSVVAGIDLSIEELGGALLTTRSKNLPVPDLQLAARSGWGKVVTVELKADIGNNGGIKRSLVMNADFFTSVGDLLVALSKRFGPVLDFIVVGEPKIYEMTFLPSEL